MSEKVNILGINIDNVTESECVEAIRQALRNKENKKWIMGILSGILVSILGVALKTILGF